MLTTNKDNNCTAGYCTNDNCDACTIECCNDAFKEKIALLKEQAFVDLHLILADAYFEVNDDEFVCRAVEHYKLAAEHGSTDAQTMLGSLYSYGVGVELNLRDSFHWFSLAAEQGNEFAKDNLSLIKPALITHTRANHQK